MTKRKLYRGNIAYDEPPNPSRGGNGEDIVPKRWSVYAKYMYQKGRKTDDKVLDTTAKQ